MKSNLICREQEEEDESERERERERERDCKRIFRFNMPGIISESLAYYQRNWGYGLQRRACWREVKICIRWDE